MDKPVHPYRFYMELSGALFPPTWLWSAWLLYGVILARALWRSDFMLLQHNRLLHLFFAACVVLLVLWRLRTPIQTGFYWHLSAMVSMTLMFGWSQAVIGGSLALLGLTLLGLSDWPGFAPSALLQVVLPASLCYLLLRLSRAWLPRHFVVYVFGNAFFAAGLIALVTGLAVAGVLGAIGAYPADKLVDGYLVFLPLMFFPEAMLNGLWMTILVVYKPQWVRSFSDEEYLLGK